MILDDGSPINVTKRAIEIAEKERYPDTIKVVTGDLFPYANETAAMEKINNTLINRLEDYVVESSNNIILGKGFLTVMLTRKK